MAGTTMIGDIELKAVHWIRQEIDQGLAPQRIPGLEGTLQQRLGRHSHRVALAGLLLVDTSAADLKTLQEKAASGEEVTFTADITTALTVEHMVIESFAAEQVAGRPDQYAYTITLVESPPLPPPAEVGGFGLDGLGFGDLGGLGDLGFDAALGDVLGDIADQAGALTDALDSALDAIDQLESLASLASLTDLGSPLQPLTDKVDQLSAVGPQVTGVLDGLRRIIS